MAINFNYDLGETVGFDGREMSLRKAVAEYIERVKSLPQNQLRLPVWVRTEGKKPGIFEANHMEQLAALPIFGRSPR
jgi:hypothetical protein